jgi:hypothetical protein
MQNTAMQKHQEGICRTPHEMYRSNDRKIFRIFEKISFMSRLELIETTLQSIQKLPENELLEIHDFAEFLLSRIEKKRLSDDVSKINVSSASYKFLEDDSDIYTVSDLKEKYGK